VSARGIRVGELEAARIGDLDEPRPYCSGCKRPFTDPATRGRALGGPNKQPRAWCHDCEAFRARRCYRARKAKATSA
jgi:hypothetical protein